MEIMDIDGTLLSQLWGFLISLGVRIIVFCKEVMVEKAKEVKDKLRIILMPEKLIMRNFFLLVEKDEIRKIVEELLWWHFLELKWRRE